MAIHDFPIAGPVAPEQPRIELVAPATDAARRPSARCWRVMPSRS
jgi:hypothetical protein